MRAKKAWSGRFASPTHALVERFTTSIDDDAPLLAHDLAGSAAHVRGLVAAGLLGRRDGARLLRGLERVARRPARPVAADEDVHMMVERRLTELVGRSGGRLHTGRSRNDQVAAAFRMYVLDACAEAREAIDALALVILSFAESEAETVMPGYTHLQRAQPVLLAHHLLAYHEMLARDRGRFRDCRRRADECPLGAGALAGAGFALDRRVAARRLGFARVTRNSLDAVSDRDFAVEFAAAAALTAVHLSRLAEEIVLWATEEFGFVALPDAFATGSSMMPQKKNPDVAELVRGKTGRLIGALVNLLTTLKGLPLAYNRDLQETKPPLFEAGAVLRDCLLVMEKTLPALRFDTRRMARAADGLALATDLADALVEDGVPFREAHAIVGGLVRHCLETGTHLRDLDAATLRRHSRRLTPAMVRRLTPARSVARRRVVGGTAPREVARQLARAARESRT